MPDSRNLIDPFKNLPNAQIFATLEKSRIPLEIANSFNVAKVHIIGKKKYNRRGAMCTDKYLQILHHPTLDDFLATQRGRELVAIENNTPRSKPLNAKQFAPNTTLIFGSENSGITPDLLQHVRYIESFGSTRSVNVGVAAGIAMYEFVRQQILSEPPR